MFDRLEMFRLSGALAEHASQRQNAATRNVAQADTPGYRAVAVADFAASLRDEPFAMRLTRASHLPSPEPMGARESFAPGPASADGNTVSIETEMANAARARGDHDRALAIYRHGLSVLRASIGGR